MAKRFDILTPRKGRDGKTYFTKIGVAFENKNGGYSLSFEALPIASMNDDGNIETRALMMEPRERDDAPRGNGTPARNNRAPVDDLDDSVPFGYAGEPARRSVFP